MRPSEDIPVVYEKGVFRPESPVAFPDRARFIMTVREAPFDEADASAAREELATLRQTGFIQLKGWSFDRESLYERG